MPVTIEPDGHRYPQQSITVHPFQRDLHELFSEPVGQADGTWPPTQIGYLGEYLAELGCKSIVYERHYIDRDFIEDAALFYARSLRNYPNYCQRLHFLKRPADDAVWSELVLSTRTRALEELEASLTEDYLGFMVVRPLPGSPVGRTVLRTVGPVARDGSRREFSAIRPYTVHLGGMNLRVSGLAFQQQDQGVSACATTALWCSLHQVAYLEGLAIPSPAEITEAASRYLLADGRALPSEGLNLNQLCEATRAAGLAPVVWRSLSPVQDRGQLYTYMKSGFAPILAIQPAGAGDGHAVCAVGLKLGDIDPPADMSLKYRDAATGVKGLYVNDDRLGPYAAAQIRPYTVDGRPRTLLEIKWPGGATSEESLLFAMVIPLPVKLRLSAARLRSLAHHLAETIATLLPSPADPLMLSTHYELGTAYRRRGFAFGLTDAGVMQLATEIVLSRYVGIIELTTDEGPLLDIVLDATETRANPATLALVKRSAYPTSAQDELEALATALGVAAVT